MNNPQTRFTEFRRNVKLHSRRGGESAINETSKFNLRELRNEMIISANFNLRIFE